MTPDTVKNVCIYRPAKTAMQSGRAGTGAWALEYELETGRHPERLMGWIASGDTLNQVSMKFSTKDEAVAFAERNGWDYLVQEARERRVKPRSYAQNFSD